MSSDRVVLTYGSDPEFMLMDQKGNYKSAIGIIEGTKEKKTEIGGGNKMFYDNVLMELNIATGYSEGDFVEKLRHCFMRASKAIYPFLMVPQASHTYNELECKHPHAKVFGCEPEYCAYEMEQLTAPTCEPGNYFRSAGGHIHLGYTGEQYPLMATVENPGTDDENSNERDYGRVFVIRMLDLFVGIPSLFIDHDPTSAPRRKLYGRAGSHRPKDYGVEYRATGNFWLASPKIASLVCRLAQFSVDFVGENGHLKFWEVERDDDGHITSTECKGYDVSQLRNTINNSDKKTAKKFMEELVKKYLPSTLYAEIFALSEPVQRNFYHEWGIK